MISFTNHGQETTIDVSTTKVFLPDILEEFRAFLAASGFVIGDTVVIINGNEEVISDDELDALNSRIFKLKKKVKKLKRQIRFMELMDHIATMDAQIDVPFCDDVQQGVE